MQLPDITTLLMSGAISILVLKEVVQVIRAVRKGEPPSVSGNGSSQSFKCGLEHGVLKEIVDRSFTNLEKIMIDQTEILKKLGEVSQEQIGISRRAITLAESAARHAEDNNRLLLAKKR